VPTPKRIVCILRSQSDPARYDTGVTADLRARLGDHNAGHRPHTSTSAKAWPWAVDVIVKFADERRALAFERYLKSGSGCAFAQRHPSAGRPAWRQTDYPRRRRVDSVPEHVIFCRVSEPSTR
jgi:putative endonuclease